VPGRDSRVPLASASPLDLGDYSGVHLAWLTGCRWYGISCLRSAFPRRPGRLLGRLVSGDRVRRAARSTTAEDWHVGFEPGPRDNPADVPRRKPDYCLNIGITWPGLIRVGDQGSRPDALVHPLGAFRRRRRRTREKLVGDTGESDPAALDRRIWR